MSREAAEQIVKQEREQKEKEQEQMPTYKGLENFKIVTKMGESVALPVFQSSIHLGAAEPSPTCTMP